MQPAETFKPDYAPSSGRAKQVRMTRRAIHDMGHGLLIAFSFWGFGLFVLGMDWLLTWFKADAFHTWQPAAYGFTAIGVLISALVVCLAMARLGWVLVLRWADSRQTRF